MRTRSLYTLFAAGMFLVIGSRALAGVEVEPAWLESGLNYVWDTGTAASPAITIGRGRNINAAPLNDFSLTNAPGGLLPAGNVAEDFSPSPPITGLTPNDGGQYFCYIVEGTVNVPAQDFLPNQYSLNCSKIPPDTTNMPLAPLPHNTNFTMDTQDAGFVGSMFRLDAGPGFVWQPWFRNGDEVLFDEPGETPVYFGAPAVTSSWNMPVDPSFYLGTATFVVGTVPPVATISLPSIFATGYILDLQISNAFIPPAAGNLAPAQIGILANGAWLGEMTTSAVIAGTAGPPRLSTYHIDTSEIPWTGPNVEITLDMTGHAPHGQQQVTVAAVVHGYHEQLLK